MVITNRLARVSSRHIHNVMWGHYGDSCEIRDYLWMNKTCSHKVGYCIQRRIVKEQCYYPIRDYLSKESDD
jgi:hypothetical protein